jgi:hypothetical protein
MAQVVRDVRSGASACPSPVGRERYEVGAEYRVVDPDAAATSDREGYLAALMRLAAIDGIAEPEELVIAEAAAGLGLDADAVAAARRLASDRTVETESLVAGVRDSGLRVCLLRDAYRLAAADGHVTTQELGELARLAAVLGVAPVEAPRRHPPDPAPAGLPEFREPGSSVDGALHFGADEIAAAIRAAGDIEALAEQARKVAALGRDLVDDGVSAAQVTRTVSALDDVVAGRAIHLVLEDEDLGGIDFCWLAFGSEGRREQTLCTDQDNGVVFDPPDHGSLEEVRGRLVSMAHRVNQALAACGFALCKGGIMAGNPAWCLSVDEWRSRFASWIDEPTPEALLNATIFFDFRPLHGNEALASALKEQLRALAPSNRRFLAGMARTAMGRRPPLGLFRDFSVETQGDHAGTLDLKCGAAALFVDAARIYALAAGEGTPSTHERLRKGATAAGVDRREVEGWVDAFHFIQVLRLRTQLEHGRSGSAPSNRLDPYSLNPLERRFFRESLRQAVVLQKRMEATFGSDAPRI